MRALVLTAPSQLQYIEVPDPVPGASDVLVEVRACGICGSDVHGMDGKSGRRIPPIIMGHEAAGVVCRVGTDAAGWVEGDRVTFDSTVYCGACPYCQLGRVNLCDDRRVLGVSCEDYRQQGAFADYVAVPARILYRLPRAVSFVQGAMVEPLSIALHAVSRASFEAGSSVVVLGAGLIGLLVIQSLRADGCDRITAVDVSEYRLVRAKEFGASVVLRAGVDRVRESVLDLTSSRGADVVFEAIGAPDTIASAIELACKGGQVVLVGNIAPRVDLPLQATVTRELTICGSAASAGEYPEALHRIADRQVDVEALVTAVEPLREGGTWMRRLQTGGSELLKVVLEPR